MSQVLTEQIAIVIRKIDYHLKFYFYNCLVRRRVVSDSVANTPRQQPSTPHPALRAQQQMMMQQSMQSTPMPPPVTPAPVAIPQATPQALPPRPRVNDVSLSSEASVQRTEAMSTFIPPGKALQ